MGRVVKMPPGNYTVEFLVPFMFQILLLALIIGLHNVLVILILVDWHGRCFRTDKSTGQFFPSLFTHILYIYAYSSSEISSEYVTSTH